MSDQFSVAIMGATGAVGQVMMEILAERNFPVGNLRLLASARSAGRTFTFRGEELTVQELREDSFEGVDIVLASVQTTRPADPNGVLKLLQLSVDAGALEGGAPRCGFYDSIGLLNLPCVVSVYSRYRLMFFLYYLQLRPKFHHVK